MAVIDDTWLRLFNNIECDWLSPNCFPKIHAIGQITVSTDKSVRWQQTHLPVDMGHTSCQINRYLQ